MNERAQRYTAVAIVLHWAIATAIVFMIPFGFWIHEQAKDGNVSRALFDSYQLHKSIGLTVLALSAVRLGWRIANPPPPLPAHMPAWEKVAAKATHWAFYGLMFALPLTGWLYVSAGYSVHDEEPLAVATRWFGLFEVPHLFGLNEASIDTREDAAEAALTAHAYLAWTAVGLVALHIAAALKHHWFDRDETLAHMVPGIRAPFETAPAPKNPVRLAVLGFGLGLVAIAMSVAVFAASTFISDATAPSPQAPSTFEVVEDQPPPAPAGALPADPAQPGAPSAWTVDQRSSSIGFSYTYEDDSGATSFDGRFARWRADIRFDPNNLDASSVVVRIETASAATGVASHDGTLPSAEWFDAGGHRTAEFRTTRIRSRGEGEYEARGRLTIRGESRDVDLPFTLSIDGDQAVMSGSTTIDRRDFGIGEDTEGDDLISREVRINVRVSARRAR